MFLSIPTILEFLFLFSLTWATSRSWLKPNKNPIHIQHSKGKYLSSSSSTAYSNQSLTSTCSTCITASHDISSPTYTIYIHYNYGSCFIRRSKCWSCFTLSPPPWKKEKEFDFVQLYKTSSQWFTWLQHDPKIMLKIY